jgi:hypothetical protein
MKLTTNLPENGAVLNPQNKKPLKEQFTGIEAGFRQFLLSYYKLPESTSNSVLMDNLDDLFAKIDLVDQHNKKQAALKYQLAGLMVDEAIRIGALKKEDKEVYTRLAVSDFDTTKEVIYGTHSNSLELDELLKLSGHQLYMSGKLERLKELSEDHFKLKLNELDKHDYRSTSSAQAFRNQMQKDNSSEPINELNELMSLSADQLYFEDGKMERLKELNFNHFKLMYTEIFNMEYLVK